MIALLALLEGPLGKLIMYGVAALFITGASVGGYFLWKHNVQQAALTQFNKEQLEQTAKDAAEMKKKVDALDKKADEIVGTVQKQNDVLQDKLQDDEKFLDSDEARKGDRPASDILKETVRRMGGK